MTMKNLVIVLTGMMLVIYGTPTDALGGKTLIFGTHPIPLMVVDDQHGVFVELTKIIAERANLDIKIVVVPAKRARVYFHEQKFDVLFPGLDAYFFPENPPIKSEDLIMVKHDFVFTKKGTRC